MWTFSPYMHIFTLCAHKITFKGMVGCPLHHLKSHLTWTFSSHVHILTSRVHFHLACMQDHFLRYGGGVSPLPSKKLPHMGMLTPDILTSHVHFHLTCMQDHFLYIYKVWPKFGFELIK